MSSKGEGTDFYISVADARKKYSDLLREIGMASKIDATSKNPFALAFDTFSGVEIEQELGKALHSFVFKGGTRYWVKPQNRDLLEFPPYGPDVPPPSGPVPKYKDGVMVFDAVQFSAWMLKRGREQLIENLGLGLISCRDAEEVAQDFGIQLITLPEPIEIMSQSDWSLPMAVAWIASYDAKVTLLACDAYRKQMESFEMRENHRSLRMEVPRTVWLLKRMNPESIAGLSSRNSDFATKVADAWKRLKNALGEATQSVATGRVHDLGSPQTIPWSAWANMTEIVGGEPYAGPKYRSHPDEWSDVRILRSFVLEKFPPEGGQEATLASGSKPKIRRQPAIKYKDDNVIAAFKKWLASLPDDQLLPTDEDCQRHFRAEVGKIARGQARSCRKAALLLLGWETKRGLSKTIGQLKQGAQSIGKR